MRSTMLIREGGNGSLQGSGLRVYGSTVSVPGRKDC